jgi:hypothetical protein
MSWEIVVHSSLKEPSDQESKPNLRVSAVCGDMLRQESVYFSGLSNDQSRRQEAGNIDMADSQGKSYSS